jgi:hypothetical protein
MYSLWYRLMRPNPASAARFARHVNFICPERERNSACVTTVTQLRTKQYKTDMAWTGPEWNPEIAEIGADEATHTALKTNNNSR